MNETERPALRLTPAGLLIVLAVVVLAAVAYSLGVPAGIGVGIIAALCVLVIGLAGAGVFYQRLAEARDRDCFPAPGRMVDAGGLRLHAQVLGNPRVEPVVIFENGEMGASPEWAWVAPDVARFGRVFLYDRPGTGWSPTPAQPVSAQELVEALHQALLDLDLLPPYILAGHGMGALLSQAFYAAYPETVRGILLVDPLPAELVPTVLPERKPGFLQRLAVRLGLPRLTGRARQYAEGLSEQEFNEMVAFGNAARNLTSRLAEGSLARSAAEQTADLPPAPDEVPVIVLSATTSDPDMDVDTRERMTALQAARSGLAAHADYRVVAGANRFSILYAHEYAQQVIADIREMAIRLKDSSSV